MSRVTTGTTTPFFIPRDGTSSPVELGRDYFLVQVVGAQAAFRGRIWEKAKQLVVTSRVDLNHPSLGQGSVQALQRSRQVSRGRAEQLGLSPNLIDLVPAVMTNVSVSIDFLLDKENRLAQIAGLINTDAFVAAISLAPAAATVAKTIGGVADKLLQTFMPGQERQPILQFAGDFNLATGALRDGYYAILGTRDEESPLPGPSAALFVSNARLLSGGRHVDTLSYVILHVRRTPVRGRATNGGAAWALLIDEAEDVASALLDDPMATKEDREAGWQKCLKLLRESQVLLRADPNYQRHEAESIVRDALLACRKLVSGEDVTTRGAARHRALHGGVALSEAEFSRSREALEIPPDEDLDESVARYHDELDAARDVLASLTGAAGDS